MFKPFFIGTAVFILAIGGMYALAEYKGLDFRDHIPVKSFNTPLPKVSVAAIAKEEKKEKIEVELYYDFTCPYCKKFYDGSFTEFITKYFDDISVSYIPYSLQTQGESFELLKKYTCIDLPDEEKFKTFIENVTSESTNEEILSIFSLIDIPTAENDENTDTDADTGIENNNEEIDTSDRDAFEACLENKELEVQLLETREQTKQKGVRGTPTFFIGDTKYEGNVPMRNLELEMKRL